ncbi:two-component sensor histidine kinase [Amycolatopsis vastitatis]|uniref:histidine kinase n=1 Tax=Amycolatopsis vastitatis TaxID=1905142 RepID=A0A229SXY4_9PSEU|nr:two-component sensor histidine kinase [Amycolatopsis vastitatis]
MRTDDTAGAVPSLLGHPLLTRMTRIGRRLRRADRDHPWLLDTAVVAVIVLLFGVTEFVHPDDGRPGDGPPITFAALPVAATLALQAGLVLPLLWRRRAPYAAFAVISAVFLLQWALGAFLRADVALLVALYSVTLHGRVRYLPWACAAAAGLLVPVAVRVSAVVSVWGALFFLVSTATAAVALGFAVRIRRAQLVNLRDRALRLEIERDQRSKLAAATERTRVAREMHDIIGHNLSVIITLADGGAYAAEVTPERSREALRLVGEAGRQALGELRRMLGVLREQATAPELHPQPRIADIEALCGRLGAAGPEVVYRSGGELESLDHGVQLMAYRIVQEALTNSLKHAGPGTRIQVALTVEGAQLRIHVHDTGRPGGTGEPSPGEGHGLAGMKERAALYGGTVTAGPEPGGGWSVRAVLDVTPVSGGPA